LEKSAHKSGVLTAMQDASVVHLACHGDMLTDSLLMAQEDGGVSGHRVLQCVAMCCSVLQCGAVCCGVLRCVAALTVSLVKAQEEDGDSGDMSTHTYTHTYTHIHIYIYIHKYIHACIDRYTNTYIHTYMLTYKQTVLDRVRCQ